MTKRLSLGRLAMYGCATLMGGGTLPARALQIVPVYDSSVTNSIYSVPLQNAFNFAAGAYNSALPNPVTIRIQVSLGSVAGRAIASNTLGTSRDPLYGYYSYSTVKSWLTRSAQTSTDGTSITYLPANPASGNRYVLPSAEARALGLLPASSSSYDGYIGFGSGIPFDYSAWDGIAPGYYDFTGVAAHEIAEVLGRISGLSSTRPAYATPFDLFRCSNGSSSFSFTTSTYFSIDGCRSSLGQFNNSGSGDRGDWASSPGNTDAQNAYIYTGTTMGISVADLMALDVLGWGSAWSYLDQLAPSSLVFVGYADEAVPEPSGLALLATGLLALIGVLRARPTRRSRLDLSPASAPDAP